ncbi:hypothetical protein [Gilliamella mensalis]|uniref:hypothetical protein n=1 Tax=Gilliamella mensalis TaxID=1908520 RepID=UPI000A15FDED|nr:hypothetical protein [Gilliamella mensalis]
MKGKKLIILYILMLVVGLALLFTKSSPQPVAEPTAEPQVQVIEVPKKTEMITIAVAKNDISKNTILTKDHYYFKSIEVDVDNEHKSEYITNAEELEQYAVMHNIAKDTFIEHRLIVSPQSPDYAKLAIKEGNYMFPFKLDQIDYYLVENLKIGDLVDIYVFYGDEGVNSRNNKEDKFVSPSADFVKNRIKPVIVGKKILYLERDNEIDSKFQKSDVGQIQLELSNREIKLLRTLMTNSTIMIYPSTYKNNMEDGLHLLSEKEKNWPLSDNDIFSGKKRINLLKGN